MKLLILLLAFCVYANQSTAMQSSDPEDEQALSCVSCSDNIPECDSHFKYDPDHLVCIHCYFYKIPRSDEGPALEYVSKNGTLLNQ